MPIWLPESHVFYDIEILVQIKDGAVVVCSFVAVRKAKIVRGHGIVIDIAEISWHELFTPQFFLPRTA